MGQIKIERYKDPAGVAGWTGYIEPPGREWVLYFDDDGHVLLFPNRDPDTGATVGLPASVPS